MVRLGGPVFMNTTAAAGPGESHGAKTDDPDALVRDHKTKGFTAAYAPNIDINDTNKICAFRKASEDADIVIAEVGYWENLVDTDADTRKANRQRMLNALALAEELGARDKRDIRGSRCRSGATGYRGKSARTPQTAAASPLHAGVPAQRSRIRPGRGSRTRGRQAGESPPVGGQIANRFSKRNEDSLRRTRQGRAVDAAYGPGSRWLEVGGPRKAIRAAFPHIAVNSRITLYVLRLAGPCGNRTHPTPALPTSLLVLKTRRATRPEPAPRSSVTVPPITLRGKDYRGIYSFASSLPARRQT